jgi:RNA polymerase sigma factor (sigma-70 family)
MKHPETKDLWRKFLAGEEDAFPKLYNLYVHKLYSYGLKIHGDENLVKDCIQEVFIQLICKREKLIFSETTELYLFKSLRNKLLEELRSKNRHGDIIRSMSYGGSDYEVSVEEIKVNAEEEQYISKIVAEALDKLSPYQKEVIFLKYSYGLDYEKIAEIMEIDIASARTLIYRSLKKVKESIGKKAAIMLFFFFRSLPKN